MFEPDSLQVDEVGIFEIGDGFDVLTVEIIFHHVVEYLALPCAVPVNKLKQQLVESLIFQFVELQVIFAIFQYFQFIAQMKLQYFRPAQLVTIAQLNELDTLQNVIPRSHLLLNRLTIIFNFQKCYYRVQLR